MLQTGSLTIGIDVTRINTAELPIQNRLIVKAKKENTGKVYIGFHPGITAGTEDENDGFELDAKDGVTINNLGGLDINEIYFIATEADQKISFINL